MLRGIKLFDSNNFKTVINTILLLIGLVSLSFLIYSTYIPKNVSITKDEIAKNTITSPRSITFESTADKEKNHALKTEIIQNIGKIYSINQKVNQEVKENIEHIFNIITKKKKKSALTEQEKKQIAYIPKQTLQTLLSDSDNNIITLEYLTLLHTEKVLSNGLKEINPETIKTQLRSQLHEIQLNKNYKSFITDTIVSHAKSNLIYDQSKTTETINKHLEDLTMFKTSFKEGQPIIYKGEKVTSLHIETLQALNMYGVKFNYFKFFGITLIVLLNFIIIERFVYYFSPNIHQHTKYFILIYIIILLICSMSVLLQSSDLLPPTFLAYYLIPITISAMIVSLLITPNISLLCGTIISILITIIYKNDFSVFFYLFYSTTVASFATYKAYKRSEIIYAGYIIGIFNIIFVVALGLYKEINNLIWYAANMLLAFGNGIFSAMIALAILPYFESIFKITTNQKLLELSNLNHPLLKRLMITTPGTYQHSIMVANLAEAAAEEINANPIVCRVGAYFHDIGKMKRPSFYTENQFSQENPHNKLAPRISKLIIAAHPRDGVELAEKYKLPQVLKDIMMEHHGTSLVSFFFSQAKQAEELKDDESTKEEFRYPGPKPHFKESGIIMLADSVEAAVRSMKKPSPAKIEALVEKIFSDKIADNQLINCSLTLKEIETIRLTFLKVFKGVYHSRINYEKEIDNLINEESHKNIGKK